MTLIAILLLLGTVFVFLETFLPGGIWGVTGVALYGWAAYEAYGLWGAFAAVGVVAAAVALCISAFLVWLKVLPKTRFGKKLYLDTKQDGTAMTESLKPLVGSEGVALTPLMPSGKVAVEGVPYDAKSEASHIEKGEVVRVIGADSFELKVKKLKH